EINPRFSQTYEFNPTAKTGDVKNDSRYVEIPSVDSLWMLNSILQKNEVLGLIGNAYLYPNGYAGYKVFFPEEISGNYTRKENLFNMAINSVSEMSTEEFNIFTQDHPHLKLTDPVLYDFLTFLNKKPE